MKEVNEILNDKRVIEVKRKVQNDKSTQLKLVIKSNYNNKNAIVKFTRAIGWEHLSVSFDDETPSWDFMQEMKELFWKDDEVCYQLHPKKSEYINNNEYCLHIWRNLEQEVKTPPTILIGFREGNEDEDRKILKQVQEDLGFPMSDIEIDLLICNNIKDPKKMEKAFNKLKSKYSAEELFTAALKFM